jgi:hypothetical protein
MSQFVGPDGATMRDFILSQLEWNTIDRILGCRLRSRLRPVRNRRAHEDTNCEALDFSNKNATGVGTCRV